MNNDFLRWLLDIDVIPRSNEVVRLVWEHPWPSWVWAVAFIGAGLFCVWTYSGLAGWRAGRGVCAAARLALVTLVLVILAGPMIELPRETLEQDWVLMLVDRSASMTIADVSAEGGGAGVARRSREQQIDDALAEHKDTIRAMERTRHLMWMGFHSGAFPLVAAQAPTPQSPEDPNAVAGEADSVLPDLGEADGRRTSLNTALEQALQASAARRIGGIVVMSDGRTDDPPDRALLRRLQAEAIPVYVVALGSPDPVGDVAVGRVDAPRRAFVRDRVPVRVQLDRLGEGVRQTGARVQLVDQATGRMLGETRLEPGDERDDVTITVEPDVAGDAVWQVRVDTDEPDLIADNNLKPVRIELIDRPLRVLFVDGYPRWEYRYLKNLLMREKSIKSSVMLLSADRDFAQEGNDPITRLPRSSEEFADFDVVVLGDVAANYFSPDQLEMMRRHIAERGAGLLWIGGERSTPRTYAGTPLADLLPMRGDLTLPRVERAVTMQPTPLAERLGVLRLSDGVTVGWPAELADASYGWSQLYGVQRIEPGQLKPTAEVLAQTVGETSGSHLPMVIAMRYGAGQSIYVATDEIWRWRYGRGELYPDQFWIQMVRMLGRESLSAGNQPAVLEAEPRRVAVGQPVQLRLKVMDAQLAQPGRESVRAVIDDGGGARTKATGAADIALQQLPGDDTTWQATWLPDAPGQLHVRVADPSFPVQGLDAVVEVFTPDDEMRRPETDHAVLASLAAATGGRMLMPGEMDQIAEVPNRSVKTRNPITERIWDTPLAFALVFLIITLEWVGRKMLRLA